MRAPALFALLSLACAAPSGAQGVIIPLRCGGACPPGSLPIDSVWVSAQIRDSTAITYVDHVLRNPGATSVSAAFFFPLPAGAVVTEVSVYNNGRLERYNQWSEAAESRWIVRGMIRDGRRATLREYDRDGVLHAAIPPIPAGGTQRVRIAYREKTRLRGGSVAYRFPLGVGSAGTTAQLTLYARVRSEHGFLDISSPSHLVRVTAGQEVGRCPPQARCGYTGVTSARVKDVRLVSGPTPRPRDFELRYTPADSTSHP